MHTSGEWIEGELPLIFQQNNMQGLVSAITYARRTSLASITGVAPVDDDDDAEAAVGRTAGNYPSAEVQRGVRETQKVVNPPAPKPAAAPRAVPSAKPTLKQAFVDALEKATADPFADVPHPADITADQIPF
jgi:hypothetical protein